MIERGGRRVGRLLAHAHSDGRHRQGLRRDCMCFGQRLAGGRDVVDQSDGQCIGRLEALAQDGQPLGLSRPQQVDQARNRAPGQRYAQRNFGQ